ncbi:glycosyltransferase [Erwinia sp. S63]|uniref:glycosyltransferase family 2 protein n=1 Tax=Erwinia sp. S63 TaxID=2769341 RepID=UPI00190BD6AF|nr:glycosyltransferase family 2 protein [Erwinia sp. S63]MBK0094573.1 glycosyltransferase [Erwinia sp. S63]
MNDKCEYKVAVVIPCYNEGIAIRKVVNDFKIAMPDAGVFVFDNNSKDNTVQEALKAGAKVLHVKEQGKGNVVRRIFADVSADVYVMVDGDATYDASCAPAMIKKLISERLDMVVGVRKHEDYLAYRPGHTLGNKMLTGCVKSIFGGNFSDMLSGYRVFSARYAKSFPAMSTGFETETELTVHALELRMPYDEFITPYVARMEGSTSKLSTYKDGIKILRMIIKLYSSERPFAFFSIIAMLVALIAVILSIPLATNYIETGLVPRIPTALLSTGLVIISTISFFVGLVLESVTLARREIKRLSYLSVPLLSLRESNEK